MLSWGMKKITNSIFLLPTCQQEVFNLIEELKNRKATRTLDIETKFIKLANPIVQKWSPRGRPWPRGHILKSLALASKPKVLGLEASSPGK